MAGSVNVATIIGNLGKDPEVRSMTNGGKVVTLTVATSETWKDKASGERRESTQWHRVVIFNEHIAKVAEQYLKKGSKVYIQGQLQTREWEKDGHKNYTTEIVLQNYKGELQMLSRADGDARENGSDTRSSGYSTQRTSSPPARSGGGQQRSFQDDMDDPIPFAFSCLILGRPVE